MLGKIRTVCLQLLSADAYTSAATALLDSLGLTVSGSFAGLSTVMASGNSSPGDGTDLLVLDNDFLVIDKASGSGIKVDTTTPTFGWRDIVGDLSTRFAGAGSPTLAAFRGGTCRALFYSANDESDLLFHVPHDYVPGSDVHLHLHWAHNGTAISGTLEVTYGVTYAKGHNQAAFIAEVAPVLTVSTPDIATIPQYRHRVDEIQLSAASPTATQLDSATIEADGLIMVHVKATTIPTITGGTTNEPAFLTCDLHYQSTNMGTKAKAPGFWT